MTIKQTQTRILSAKATKAAVIGNPISHSLSPIIHNYLLEKYNIDGVYLALPITKEDLQTTIDALIKMGFAGFNVTIPHKEAIFKMCDHTSKTASLTKAVNTVIITEEGKLFGHNSDAEGFINNLHHNYPDLILDNKTAFVIGAGGAARAITYSLIKAKVTHIVITNRNQQRAEGLIHDFTNFAQENACKLEFLDSQNFETQLNRCDVLINSTSLGMIGQEQLQINLEKLSQTAIVCDIVYNPLMTNLLKDAQKRGNKINTGIGMLICQALVGFEFWFKQKPEIDDHLEETLLTLI